jgi:hypothetical protein
VSIGQRLIDDIEATQMNGDSLRSIAVKSRVPYPVLWRFANGQRDLTLRTADKLLKHFGAELVSDKKLRLKYWIQSLITERLGKESRDEEVISQITNKLADSILEQIEKATDSAARKMKAKKKRTT